MSHIKEKYLNNIPAEESLEQDTMYFEPTQEEADEMEKWFEKHYKKYPRRITNGI